MAILYERQPLMLTISLLHKGQTLG